MIKNNNYTHLSIADRKRIEILMAKRCSINKIADLLGRNKSTISREIKRNSVNKTRFITNWSDLYNPHVVNDYYGIYSSVSADKLANKRSLNCHKHYKIVGETKRFIINKLHIEYSPQIISNLLWNERKVKISYETIYKFIYSKANQKLKLWEYLDKHHTKRRNKHKKQGHRKTIKHRVSIHKRPEEINNRSDFGHWEGDSVSSAKRFKGGIHTEVERKSRLLCAEKINDLTAALTVKTQKSIFSKLPKGSVKSTTLDNGIEMHRHYELNTDMKIDTYFADPYSSYQRGTNEHMNGLIRRFFPKGTNFKQVSDEELQNAVNYWNNRPMKCLGYRTPQQVFDDEVAKL